MLATANQGSTPPGHDQGAPAQAQANVPPGQAEKQAPAPGPAVATPVQQSAPAPSHVSPGHAKKQAAVSVTPTTKLAATKTVTTTTTTKAASKSKGAGAPTAGSLPPGQAKKLAAAQAAATPAPAAQTPAPTAPATTTRTVKKPKAKARRHRAAATNRRATGGISTVVAPTRAAAAITASPVAAATLVKHKAERANKTDGGGYVPAKPAKADDAPSVVFRTVRDAVEVVPTTIWILLGLLTGLACLFAVTSARQTRRARRFAAEAGTLMGDVGVLQEAVLPVVPPRVGALALSVAHRPAGGPAAGGDFYDVIPLDGDRTALVVGDVTGHGPGALGQATLVRFTLRAHLESGAGPREALAIATESLAQHFDEGFATAAVAIHDPKAGTLTYATAAHEAPIVVGPGNHAPVLVSSTPPLGIGAGGPSARRQTVVPFPEGSLACMLTDGALEARVRGELVGRARVEEWVRELGERPAAGDMAEMIRSRAAVSDDLAVCFATATAGADSGSWRVEELHRPTPQEAERFLDACGATAEQRHAAAEALRFSRDNAVLTVRFEDDAVLSASVVRNGSSTPVAA